MISKWRNSLKAGSFELSLFLYCFLNISDRCLLIIAVCNNKFSLLRFIFDIWYFWWRSLVTETSKSNYFIYSNSSLAKFISWPSVRHCTRKFRMQSWFLVRKSKDPRSNKGNESIEIRVRFERQIFAQRNVYGSKPIR